ncbi:MAG: TonB-dependent receptor [Paludibacteraceae bacterium]|nr:TonB-dependent receptor [Paludibacteraceae bacterium]
MNTFHSTKQSTRLLMFAMMLLMSFAAMAQTVSGVVSDAGKEPIIGASVLEQGTSNGTVTDFDGHFTLNVSDANATLVVSYVGMKAQEVALKGRTNLQITLQEDKEVLDEVVVIGYGTAKRRDITTAVSSVSTDDIEKHPITSAAQAIQGKAAGVTVVKPNGQPGADMVIRVRGTTSMNGSNDPLYVVDGVPMTDIAFLAPNDIESMQILKDASSAAIYGSRAANGVIMITTKAGSANKEHQKVAFSMYGGWTKVAKTMESLNLEQYREYLKDLGSNVLLPDGLKDETDWFKETYTTGSTQNYQLSVSGGTDKVNYFISGGYTTEKGIVNSTAFDRYNFRTALDAEVTKWLKVGANVAYSYSDKTGGISSGAVASRGGLVLSVINTPTYAPIYNENNQYYTNFYGVSSITHPLENIERYKNQHNKVHRMLATGKGTFTLYDTKKFERNDNYNHKFTFNTTFTEDLRAINYTQFLDPEKTSWGRNQYGEATDTRSFDLVTVWDNVLDYNTTIGKNSIDVMLGSSYTHSMYTWAGIYGSHFANGDIQTLNAANKIDPGSTSTSASEWAIMSGFARVNYNYDGKYILSANFRADGSSKLAPGHRWGFFPSVSAAWRVSGEEFMKDVDWTDDLKIRGGWGQTGNQGGIGDYAYLERYGISRQDWWKTGNEHAVPTFYQSSLRNTDLTWETTSQANVGFDWTMFKNRFTVNFDWYLKNTTNMLMWVSLPAGSAAVSSIQRNEGSMRNMGVELTLSSRNFVKKNFKWSTDFNISHNKNKLLSLETSQVYYDAKVTDILSEYCVRNTPGMPLGSFFGYKTGGVDPETGELIYLDANGDGEVTASDRTYIGDPNPDFTFGMTNSFEFYGVSISFMLQGSYGNDIFNASRIETEGMYDARNQSVRVLDRWRRPGMETTIPKAGFDMKVSDYFIEDGSYLRLKDLTIGYEFSGEWMKKIGMSRLQPYFSAQNLLTLTKYMGMDPEVNQAGNSGTVQGLDFGTYPQTRSFVLGLNIEF